MVRGHWKAAKKAWHWSLQVYQHPPGGRFHFKRHLRWATAAALRPGASLEWFSFHEDPAHAGFVAANPRLVFRAMTSYMSVRWGLTRRIKVIQDTYSLIARRGGFLAEALQRPEGAVLARLDLERGVQARIRLGSDAQFRKEGELSVFLEVEGMEGSVTGMALSLEQEGEWVLRIGGMQGRKGGEEETIKLLTKAMHGLRPKNLMILLAQELALVLGIPAIRGVGNAIQVFRARLNNPFVPKRKIRFDFDALWTEVGGVELEDGWFGLPLTTPRRGPDEIKPNKRSMYAKRYAMLDDLRHQIWEQLAL